MTIRKAPLPKNLDRTLAPIEKFKRESNFSLTISEITNGAGTPRKLNVHVYRVANTRSPGMSLGILDGKGQHLASVVLHGDEIRQLVSEITYLI
jgi:hypothetical protein